MHGDDMFVRFSGDLDAGSAPQALELVVRAMSACSGHTLTFDMAEVTFADSSAVGMLLDAKNLADAAGVTFVLVNVPAQFRRVLEITAMEEVFGLDPASDAAGDAPPESA
jgi:anti-anti-sigma factor